MLPNEGFIIYLGGYGANPENASAYDEHIVKAIEQYHITPISLKNKFITQIENDINELEHGVILITGTAGDGKSYLCRQVWKDLFGETNKDKWEGADKNIVETTYQGKNLCFIKDLSATTQNSGEEVEIVNRLDKILLNEDKSLKEILIIAANDGQILEKFNKATNKIYNPESVIKLKRKIENTFLEHAPFNDELIKLYDQRSIINSDYIKEAIDAIVDHKSWSNCQSCDCKEQCPILKNALSLKELPFFRQRIQDMLFLVMANGEHITTRNLLLLIANIILGESSKDSFSNHLLDCAGVKRLIDKQEKFKSNIYDNVLGFNLPSYEREKYQIFSQLGSLKIGAEGVKSVDDKLLYDENFVISGLKDPSLEEALDNLRKQYIVNININEINEEDLIKSWDEVLQQQRRLLFFNQDKYRINNLEESCWNLSIFHFAQEYIALTYKLRDNKKEYLSIKESLMLALNRIFTGFFVGKSSRDLYVAFSGGYSKNKINVICPIDYQIDLRRNVRLESSSDLEQLPQIVVDVEDESIVLKLTPIRFEFLMRVALGYLTTSFLGECLEDILGFKVQILSAIEKFVDSNAEFDEMSLLSLDEQDGRVNEDSININWERENEQ